MAKKNKERFTDTQYIIPLKPKKSITPSKNLEGVVRLHERHNQKKHGNRSKMPADSNRSKMPADISTAIESVAPQVQALLDLEKNATYRKDVASLIEAENRIESLRESGLKAGFREPDQIKGYAQAQKDALAAQTKVAAHTVKAIGFKHKGFAIDENELKGPQKQMAVLAATSVGKLSPQSDMTMGFVPTTGRSNFAGAQFGGFGDENRGVSFMSRFASPKSFFHEAGHGAENHWGRNKNEARIENASRFREARIAGEKSVSLNSALKTSKFEEHEVGSKDNFEKAIKGTGSPNSRQGAYYIGKDYSFMGKKDTEITSTGTELLFRSPAAFARADPEWAGFVIATHRGAMD